MDNHQTPIKTPSNFLGSLPKDVREAVNKRKYSQGSPYNCLPHHTTPPSRFFSIKNPFEAVMNEHFHKHIFSPSVFQEVKNPTTSEKFKWTIDDISSLKPANIDINSTSQFEHVQTNPEEEVQVQAKIEKYFSETHIVPSPWNQDVNHAPLLPEAESPAVKKIDEPKNVCNVWTQTVLSLPPNLPEEVEKALKPFFTFTEDQRRQSVDMNSSLCRRLFNFEAGTESDNEEYYNHSIHQDLSVIGSPIIEKDSNIHKRNFDSSPSNELLIPVDLSPIHNSTPRKLSDCPISPISTVNLEHEELRSSMHHNESSSSKLSPIDVRKSYDSHSFAKMDFSGHMSVDNSFNLAPENDNIDVGNQTNLSESPVRTNEFMESCNWDIEYKNISLNGRAIRRNLFEPKQNSTERMDISNLTTPKSKIINSQRKKLSDSFKLSESFTEDEVLNFEYNENEEQTRKRFNFCDKYEDDTENNFVLSQNTQDTGYNTCPEGSNKLNYSKDEDMIVADLSENPTVEKENRNLNIFASTPSKTSKRYFSNLDN